MKAATLTALFLFAVLTMSLAGDSVPPPAKEKLKLYLLMGQSNMAGRGIMEKEDLTPHPRVFLLNSSNQWEVAIEPITRYEPKKTPGVGPGLAFGKAMADADQEMAIGLVPCAVGGTQLKRWVRGADLYSNAVSRAKIASGFGTIAGVIWHQGEGDAGSETNATSYSKRLEKMILDFRNELQQPNLPFIVGQIGEFNYNRVGNPLPFARMVNEALANIPKKVSNTGCALAKNLSHKGDELHFSAKAQRELGNRYAREMLRVQKSIREETNQNHKN